MASLNDLETTENEMKEILEKMKKYENHMIIFREIYSNDSSPETKEILERIDRSISEKNDLVKKGNQLILEKKKELCEHASDE